MHGIAVGLVPHTGWAWLVRTVGSPAEPRVEVRARVVACEVLDGEIYHLAAEREHARAQFVAARRTAALAQAIRAVTEHVAGARAAVVLGKQMTLPPLERIVAAHPMIHGAEGELWRALFAEACAARGLRVTRAEASQVRRTVIERHGAAVTDAFLHEAKRIVGAPWSREPQDAALAAWSVLT